MSESGETTTRILPSQRRHVGHNRLTVGVADCSVGLESRLSRTARLRACLSAAALLLCTVGIGPQAVSNAYAYHGDCGQPVSITSGPTASDTLRMLRKAVGQDLLCRDFICDVNDSGAINTTDALITLRKAVGQSVTFDCPAYPGDTLTACTEAAFAGRLVTLNGTLGENDEKRHLTDRTDIIFDCGLDGSGNPTVIALNPSTWGTKVLTHTKALISTVGRPIVFQPTTLCSNTTANCDTTSSEFLSLGGTAAVGPRLEGLEVRGFSRGVTFQGNNAVVADVHFEDICGPSIQNEGLVIAGNISRGARNDVIDSTITNTCGSCIVQLSAAQLTGNTHGNETPASPAQTNLDIVGTTLTDCFTGVFVAEDDTNNRGPRVRFIEGSSIGASAQPTITCSRGIQNNALGGIFDLEESVISDCKVGIDMAARKDGQQVAGSIWLHSADELADNRAVGLLSHGESVAVLTKALVANNGGVETEGPGGAWQGGIVVAGTELAAIDIDGNNNALGKIDNSICENKNLAGSPQNLQIDRDNYALSARNVWWGQDIDEGSGEQPPGIVVTGTGSSVNASSSLNSAPSGVGACPP